MAHEPKWWVLSPDAMLAGEVRRVRRHPSSVPEAERVRIRGVFQQPENGAFINIKRAAIRQQDMLLRQLLAEYRLFPDEVPAYARERMIAKKLGLTVLQVRKGLEIAFERSHDGLL